MQTSLAEEREAQRRWELRPAHRHLRVFDRLVENEFLDPPQVAILGVGSIQLRPVQAGEQVEFVPHIGLSLTINHQVVDGAPGARFLQSLGNYLSNFELMLAI